MRISVLTIVSLAALKCATAVAVPNSSEWDDYELQRAIAASLQTHAEEEKARAREATTSSGQDLSTSMKRHMENFQSVQKITGTKIEGHLAPTTVEEEKNDYQLAVNRSRLTYMDELKKSGQVTNVTKLSDIFPELKPKTSKALPALTKEVLALPALPKTVLAASSLPKEVLAVPTLPKTVLTAPAFPKEAPAAPAFTKLIKATPTKKLQSSITQGISAEQLKTQKKNLKKTEEPAKKVYKPGKSKTLQNLKKNLKKTPTVSSKEATVKSLPKKTVTTGKKVVNKSTAKISAKLA